MGMMRFPALLTCLAVPVGAAADPTYHRVIGVAANDVLNIRSAPDANSMDIGDLAHDARGIEVLGVDPSGQWARIALAERDGWVATRFLATDSVGMIGATGIPSGLVCGGTEPFWSLALGPDGAAYAHPEDGESALSLGTVRVAEGRLGSPALFGLAGAGEQTIDATVHAADCNDGMSDRSYGWAITLRLMAPGQDRFLAGCCHLPRD